MREMPDAAADRITASLTMCRRAGQLQLGFDAVKDALTAKTVSLVLLAADASAKTEKEIRFFAGEVPVRRIPLTMEQLSAFFRKKRAVLGVCGEGFAKKLLSYMQDEAPS